jgi:hypothetical protein
MIKPKTGSTIAPYFFRNKEDKELYKKYYQPGGLPWSEVVEKHGSPAAKRYYARVGGGLNNEHR